MLRFKIPSVSFFNLVILGFISFVIISSEARPQGLEAYLQAPNKSFRWSETKRWSSASADLYQLELSSQTWRDTLWTHQLQLVFPKQSSNKKLCFLYLTGSKEVSSLIPFLEALASAGVATAVLNNIPNQPLFGDKRENALIAYSFRNYLNTGDDSWPVIFPMVKAAQAAADAIVQFSKESRANPIEEFVLSGASKRGWTSWLTAAVDKRVVGVAPMVFDMLNMKAQTDWAQKTYGKQSEKIIEFTKLGLIAEIDTPRNKQLRAWVDPYEQRSRYKMPKLVILGTNDPYWVVDATQHYIADLPGVTYLFQLPNGDHNISQAPETVKVLTSWLKLIAENQPLPKLSWQFETESSKFRFRTEPDVKLISMTVWSADSSNRDFRASSWKVMKHFVPTKGTSEFSSDVLPAPNNGYRAYLANAELNFAGQGTLTLSSEVKVMGVKVK